VLSGEATNTNCIVFGLSLSGLELTIYCTRGEQANHYITDTGFAKTSIDVQIYITGEDCL